MSCSPCNPCGKSNVNNNCANLYLDVGLGTGPFANYLLTIVNNGPQTAFNVGGTFIMSSVPPAPPSEIPGTITIGDPIPPGGSTQFSIFGFIFPAQLTITISSSLPNCDGTQSTTITRILS